MKCRHCGSELRLPFVDLGTAPPSNAYLTREQLSEPEKWYPLRVLVCENCWLVQTEDYVGAGDLFTDDYAYFSSVSHNLASITLETMSPRCATASVSDRKASLQKSPRMTAICCNMCRTRNSMLRHRADQKHGVGCAAKGIFTSSRLFSERSSRPNWPDKGQQADLIVANNVLAHVPDINDFTRRNCDSSQTGRCRDF